MIKEFSNMYLLLDVFYRFDTIVSRIKRFPFCNTNKTPRRAEPNGNRVCVEYNTE